MSLEINWLIFEMKRLRHFTGIAMFLVTSPIVINVPTRGLLAAETMHAIVRWLANLNIKRNMTSMFVNKKHRYSVYSCPGGIQRNARSSVISTTWRELRL